MVSKLLQVHASSQKKIEPMALSTVSASSFSFPNVLLCCGGCPNGQEIMFGQVLQGITYSRGVRTGVYHVRTRVTGSVKSLACPNGSSRE